MCLFTGVNRCVYTFIRGGASPGWQTQSASLNVSLRSPESSNTDVCGYACNLLLDNSHQTDIWPTGWHRLKWWETIVRFLFVAIFGGVVSYRPTQNTIWYVSSGSSYSCFKRLCSFIWTASDRSSVKSERPGFPRQRWHLKVTLRLRALLCEFTSFSFKHVSLWPPEHVIKAPPVHLTFSPGVVRNFFSFSGLKRNTKASNSPQLLCAL